VGFDDELVIRLSGDPDRVARLAGLLREADSGIDMRVESAPPDAPIGSGDGVLVLPSLDVGTLSSASSPRPVPVFLSGRDLETRLADLGGFVTLKSLVHLWEHCRSTVKAVTTAHEIGIFSTSEEKEAELQRALLASAEEWRLTFDTARSAIFVFHLDGSIVRLNSAGRQLAGMDYPDLIGRDLGVLGDRSPWIECQELLAEVIETGSTRAETVHSAEGAWDLVVGVSSKGTLHRAVLTLQDVSKREALQDELHHSQTMTALGKLVAGVAHEVRNPLFGLSAATDNLADEFAEMDELQDYIRIFRGEVRRLNEVMGDLLEYGRPSSVQLESLVLGDVVRESANGCSAIAGKRDVSIECLEDDEGTTAFVDRVLLTRALQNLIENGIQHSSNDSTVSVAWGRKGGSSYVTVTDEGSGLTVGEEARVFDPFYSRREGGVGLGLSIVQRAVSDCGGEVVAENSGDGGARFTVTVPSGESQRT